MLSKKQQALRRKLLTDSGFHDLESIDDGLLSRKGTTECVDPVKIDEVLSYHLAGCQLLHDTHTPWPTARIRQVWQWHIEDGHGRVELQRMHGVTQVEYRAAISFGRSALRGRDHSYQTVTKKVNKSTRWYHSQPQRAARMVRDLSVAEVLAAARAADDEGLFDQGDE